MTADVRTTPIAVCDAVWTGHVPMFHHEICAAFLALGHPVYSIAPEAREKAGHTVPPALSGRTVAMRRWVPAVPGEPVVNTWIRVREHLEAIAERHSRPPLAYFPFVDFAFLRPGLTIAEVEQAMPFVWGGLLLSPSAQWPGFRRKKRPFEQLLQASTCAGIHLLTEDAVGFYATLFPGKVVLAMPDFTDTAIDPAERRFNGLTRDADGRPLFVFAGNICERKGFDWFVGAAHRAARKGRPWSFLAVGSFSLSSVRSAREYRRLLRLLERRPGVALTPFRVPESDLNAIIQQATAVWCMYREFPWSSNVLTKAAAFGVPVLTGTRGVIAQRQAEFRLGVSAPEGDAGAIDRALERLADPGWQQEWRQLSDCERFAARHSVSRLGDALKGWLQAALERQERLSR